MDLVLGLAGHLAHGFEHDAALGLLLSCQLHHLVRLASRIEPRLRSEAKIRTLVRTGTGRRLQASYMKPCPCVAAPPPTIITDSDQCQYQC